MSVLTTARHTVTSGEHPVLHHDDRDDEVILIINMVMDKSLAMPCRRPVDRHCPVGGRLSRRISWPAGRSSQSWTDSVRTNWATPTDTVAVITSSPWPISSARTASSIRSASRAPFWADVSGSTTAKPVLSLR